MRKSSSKKKKNGINVRETVISILIVLVLLVVVAGVSYAVWSRSFTGVKENSLQTGYVSFTYKESDTNVISIENAIPVADEVGKKQKDSNSMFDFNVSTKYKGVDNINYEVYSTLMKSTLDSKYVKVYLTDQNDNPLDGYSKDVPVYDALSDSLVEDGKTLYKGSLKSGDVKNLRLRIWLSSEYSDGSESKTFAFKVNVKGEA